MSLRDIGIFAPLKADHPSIGDKCWKCGRQFGLGTRLSLMATQTPDETGSLTVQAAPVCANCFAKGREIMTPAGRRIIERIKDGDGSPYPIETTDGNQWQDDEITS